MPRDRVAHRLDPVALDDHAGDAVGDRFVRAAAASGDHRHAGRRRLEEHDPEPFGFQPAPSIATRHGEHVAAAEQRGQVGLRDPPEEVHPVDQAAARRALLQPTPIAAGAADREVHARQLLRPHR